MKRLALVAAVFFVAACTPKKDEPATDTAAAAVPAPAPAAMDSGMKSDSAKMDSTMKHDSAAKADSAKKKP
jgi:hypothetical protein